MDKHIQKPIGRLILLGLLPMLLLAPCGCAKEDNAPETASIATAQPTQTPEPEAKYDPVNLQPGSRKDNDNTSDLWYPNGVPGSSYIYFTNALCSAGICYDRVEDGEIAGGTMCAETEGMHLVNETDSSSEKIDIVFLDAFNCYDYVTKTWYSRGDLEAYNALFADTVMAAENDETNTYTINADGTVTEMYEGEEYTGTWEIETDTRIDFRIDDYDYRFDIVFNEDGSVDHLECAVDRTFRFVD